MDDSLIYLNPFFRFNQFYFSYPKFLRIKKNIISLNSNYCSVYENLVSVLIERSKYVKLVDSVQLA